MHKSAPKFWFNPLITDGECTGHATLGTCYQLVQSVLKIGFTLAKMVGYGEVGGFQHWVPCTWHLPCRNPLFGTDWTISLIFIPNGHRKGSSAFVGALYLALQTVFCREKQSLIGEP